MCCDAAKRSVVLAAFVSHPWLRLSNPFVSDACSWCDPVGAPEPKPAAGAPEPKPAAKAEVREELSAVPKSPKYPPKKGVGLNAHVGPALKAWLGVL